MGYKLEEISFFSKMGEQNIKKLASISFFKHYHANELLFYEGDDPKYLYILLDGVLRLYKTNPKGQEIYMHQFVPVSMIGELANFENIKFPASAKFITSGTILKIEYKKLEEDFFKNPEICMEIIRSLTTKVKILSNVIHQEMILTSEAKVAKFINEHTELFQSIRNNQIAAILNVSPETLSRTLAKLKKDAIISIDKKHSIIIHDSKALELLYS